MKIREKILCGFAFVAAIGMILGIVGLISTMTLTRMNKEQHVLEKEKASVTSVLNSHFAWRQQVNEILLFGTVWDAAFESQFCTLGKWLESGEAKSILDPVIISLMRDLEAPHTEMHDAVQVSLDYKKSNENDKATEHLLMNALPAAQNLTSLLIKMEERYTALIVEQSMNIESTGVLLNAAIISIITIALTVCAIFAYLITRNVERALNKSYNALEERGKVLETALEQAAAASKAKGDFLSNMSHEMRTPMNAIVGMTAIGKKTESIEEKNVAFMKIENASSHLLGVINDVLDMAKIEANKLELAPIEYNFERMLQKLMAVVNFRIDEKQQQLSVKVDQHIPKFIVGDDQRLSQAITNLMSNAIKFTPEGGNIRFEASLVDETDGICELRMEVADSGIGISPDQQDQIFHAFEQAENETSRKYGGTGLGLAITKRIIELMGGSIRIESELGKGSKFIFTVKTLRSRKSPKSMLSPDVNWETARILIVDDMPEICEHFKDVFNQLSIKCDVAADGLEACRIIEENDGYDIYFVDWRMPGMDGIELTKRIKSRKDGRPSVVILITAADWEQVKDEGINAGVDKYLIKPLFSSDIVDCLNEFFGTSCYQEENTGTIDGEFAGKTMLLAEDVEINREILMALLEDTGFVIDCAVNGKEALDMVSEAPDKYDIIFMDLQMPVMGGIEATQHIRSLPVLQDAKLPIIALTANVFQSDIDACVAAGMDGHLGKPLDIDKILEVLRNCFTRHTIIAN